MDLVTSSIAQIMRKQIFICTKHTTYFNGRLRFNCLQTEQMPSHYYFIWSAIPVAIHLISNQIKVNISLLIQDNYTNQFMFSVKGRSQTYMEKYCNKANKSTYSIIT